jgi:hypothetical protein
MSEIDRRAVLSDFLPGVVVATGAAAMDLAVISETAESMPFGSGNTIKAMKAEGLVQKAQAEPAPSTRPAGGGGAPSTRPGGGPPSSRPSGVTPTVRPRPRPRRRRRRVCFWRRGRRVCEWRWV